MCVEGGCEGELLHVVFYVLYLPAGGCPWGAQTEWCGRRLALHPSRRLIPALSKGRRREEMGGMGGMGGDGRRWEEMGRRWEETGGDGRRWEER